MTDKLTTIFNEFKSSALNELAGTLITRNKDALVELREAQELLTKALLRHFLNGKDVHENYYLILEECSTQREFANRIGLSESVLSNDLRAYRALEERGVETPKQFRELLDRKGIQPTVSNWEKLPTLLEDPTAHVKDKRDRDEKSLEYYHGEIEKIKQRNEGANPEVAERAEDVLKYTQDVKKHVEAQDVYKSGWRNRDYLDFVKSIGFDYITWQPSEQLDPHHTLPSGTSSGPYGKVADVFTIPVSRKTHDQIQGKKLNQNEQLEVAEALIRTMALFITTQMKSDNG